MTRSIVYMKNILIDDMLSVLVEYAIRKNMLLVLCNKMAVDKNNNLLTKPRKQTLSTQAPQQPRKLVIAKSKPTMANMIGTWSITRTGSVGLSRNSDQKKNVSPLT